MCQLFLSVQRKNKIAYMYTSFPGLSFTVLFVLLRPGTAVHRLKTKGKNSDSNKKSIAIKKSDSNR